jgi:uncharacterized damage-inducible protein DinB
MREAQQQAAVHAGLRILNHVFVVDEIFKAHLLGQAHGHSATNTVATLTVADLAERVRALDDWYVAYAQGASALGLR